ncbi:hypothetical protein ABZR86_03760 [Dyella marensis]|jgi:hypothetical protein|uniref:Copper resistance protein D n=1 Tax=Dyella marensis TaxID=500610 RepID=A0A1I1Z586_9GAMM|nr:MULTISPECIES: hypothetical protein [Dyella]SFE27004.1 hypothetical protein SAMN02799615_00623 [Dyella marensis]
MQYVLMVAISLHVLAAVFWAGSTAALARTGGSETRRLFRPQMGAAAVAVLTGGYLWHVVHAGAVGPVERSLMIGALSALAALAVQVIVVGGALRKGRGDGQAAALPPRIVIGHRIAAALLMIAVVTMAASRYV